MRPLAIVSWVLLALSLIGSPVRATSITVPGNYATFEGAVDALTDTPVDTIFIEPGFVTGSTYICGLDGQTIVGLGDSLTRPSLGPLVLCESAAFVNVRFTGTVQTMRQGRLSFHECRLEAGLTTNAGGSRAVDMVGCRVSGTVLATGDASLSMNECWFDQGSIVVREGTRLQVTNTTFTGPGDHVAVGASGEVADAHVRGCTFRGIGTALMGDGHFVIQDNVIEECGAAASLQGDVTFDGNIVRNCRKGFDVVGPLQMSHNVITGIMADCARIRFEPGSKGAAIGYNVIGTCEGYGLYVERPISAGSQYLQVFKNTVYGNTFSGIALQLDTPAPPPQDEIAWNISYGNGGHGMISMGAFDPTLVSCNDWFANDSSAVFGMDPGASDLEVDPKFCDVAADNVYLFVDSPVADAPGCGQIGAREVGCGATSTLLERFEANVVESRVQLRWRFSTVDPPLESWIERSGHSSSWRRIGSGVRESDGSSTLEDTDVETGRTYLYRLAWHEGGRTVRGETIAATLSAAATSLQLAPISPNPTAGADQVRWSMPQDGTVDLRIFDVAGREIARIATGHYLAGTHSVSWNGLTSRGHAPNGIYFVRMRGSKTLNRSFLLRR